MLNLTFERRRDSIFRILCLGAHSDDIEIGCGGTVLRILEENPDATDFDVVKGQADRERTKQPQAPSPSWREPARRRLSSRNSGTGSFPTSVLRSKGSSRNSNADAPRTLSSRTVATTSIKITVWYPN